jgi:hypothetical protein
MPNLRINGSLPDGDGTFYLSSLYFLCPSVIGWNEFTMELSGGGSFIRSGDTGGGATLLLRNPIESLDIKEGKIRRGNTRITGTQALTSLHNRRERIASLVQWMEKPSGASPEIPQFANQEKFETYWNPILLPETVKARKRPAPWKEEEAVWASAGSAGDDIKWNRVYTEKVFPEELWPVRNSGTLLRDWEEASGWIYFEFEWEHIIETLTRTIDLKKVK